ncbi:MAG: LacI family DNA-binding transcriptional regulator [Gammaproteobacteria bacterium]
MTVPPPAPATLRQVAKHAGVHLSTVSRALDPERRHLISRDIVAKVEAAAKELGWRPNRAAASLRKGRSMVIGVLVPDMTNLVTAQIMQGVEAAIVPRGFFPLVVSMNAVPSGKAMVERLLWQRVDGVVVATLDDELLAALAKAGLPAVLTSRADPDGRFSAVHGDRERAASLAIDHLHALGHRRIALLATPQNTQLGIERLRFATAALARHGLEPQAVAVADGTGRDAGLKAMQQRLAGHGPQARPPFTAVCAANDLLALGAYEAARQAGLLVPQHLSVVGQNDMLMADLVSPPLTTVRMQHLEMGRQAGTLMIEEIEARAAAEAPRPPRVIVFQPELVVRQSTGAADA